jgi:hypothetical protein
MFGGLGPVVWSVGHHVETGSRTPASSRYDHRKARAFLLFACPLAQQGADQPAHHAALRHGDIRVDERRLVEADDLGRAQGDRCTGLEDPEQRHGDRCSE